MEINVDLAKRYRIESESYIDNTGNGSFHNHYEYNDYLVYTGPQDDDIVSYNGKEVCRGRFLGHPNDDKSLYLVKSGGKVSLYEDEILLMDGENLFIYGDLCVQQCEGKYYIVDLKNNSEITSIENTTFSGYDAEHQLFAFGDKVYALEGDKLTKYQGESKIFKFDMPTYDIEADAYIKSGLVVQNGQYETKVKHSYNVGTVSSDAHLLTIACTTDDKTKDKQDIIDIYFDKLLKYDGKPEQKEEINRIKQVYSILYDEDITYQKNEKGLTPFEVLCSGEFVKDFFALRDFYLDDFKKETDTKLSSSFTLYEKELFSRDDLTDDDIKLIADFIARNPKVWNQFSDCDSNAFKKLATVSPEMIVSLVKYSSDINKHSDIITQFKKARSEHRSLINDILQQHGIPFYHLEDFVLAPNKEFWESIKDKGFGEPRAAFKLLCDGLKRSAKDSFSYVTTKKLLIELMRNNPECATSSTLNWYEKQYNSFLVENGLTQDEKIIAKAAACAEESKTQHSLEAIDYGKRDISLNCKLEDIVDFTDCDYAAPKYHLSNRSRTTFLNEMLIYGRGKEAAYALSHGASPFQKIEFFSGKKTGMPFTGLFLRAQKDNFAGVQSLMNEIARYLDVKKGQQIIVDIEKSLGQNLRSNPAVAEIMKNMRETFMHAKFDYEKKQDEDRKYQRELEESRKFKIEHQAEIDELDKAYRIASRKKVDEYVTIFDGSTEFCLGRYSSKCLYTSENLDMVRDTIAQMEAYHQLVARIKEQLNAKDESTNKSIKDRFSEFGYNIYLTDDEVVFKQGIDSYSRKTIPFAEDTISRLEAFVKKQEEARRIEQEQEAERQRLLEAQEKERQLKEQYKAMGLPSDIRVWYRVGAGTNCSDAWVIQSDGSFREPTKFEAVKRYGDGYKTWEQILPGEVVLSWAKGNTAAEHDFEVVYMPKGGLTAAQKDVILHIEENIQEQWKDKRGLSSGLPSPDVGMGWNICGRKVPLQNKERFAPVNVHKEEKAEQVETPTGDNSPDRPIEEDDLARLLDAFGQSR